MKGKPLYIMFFCLFVASTIFILRSYYVTQHFHQEGLHQFQEANCVQINTSQVITRYSTVYRKDLPPLQDALNTLDWDQYEAFVKEQQAKKKESKNIYLPTAFYETYLNALVPYLEQPPPHEIEVPVRPTPLAVDCTNPKYRIALTGNVLETPVKVYDFVPFNAELDVLEMRLYELNDTVDYFVILESTLTHRAMRKPLFYARNTER